jgi:hypothetical protein
MLMNALYMQHHLQHQRTHYHVHCPTPDCSLLVKNKQRALVFHLCHIILLQLRVENQDLICISITKLGTLLHLPNAFAASALTMALSNCLLQCMLILISDWNHVQHLEV